MLVVMPFDDLKLCDSDDSTLRVDISSRFPIDRKSIELLTFAPPMRDSPNGMFVIANRYLTPHCTRLLQERIQAPLAFCMILSSARSEDAEKPLQQVDQSGFIRAFATLAGQDIKTFTGTLFLNVEQLKKQLDKEDFQEIGSMAAFNVLDRQFQMFIMNQDYLNDEYVAMTRNYFIQYMQQAIPEFRDTLIQHLESVKKSVDERVQLKKEYDNWVNERPMQTTEEKVDTSRALDASSVDTECSRTESKEQDTSSRSGNDAHDDSADIRPIYDEEPMAEVQTTAEIDVFAIGQHHTEQPEFNNE
nr:hypothetical protein [Tanacetum cinerariifolium]